jgi:hypothetical protein
MFFHKFHFICCDVVNHPTGKKRKTFLGFFGQFQFCLDPACLSKDPSSNLQFVLKIQPQLDRTFDQIKCAIDIICPEDRADSSQSDRHLEEFKSSRLLPLNNTLRDNLPGKTFNLIRASCKDIKKLGLSYPYSRSSCGSCHWKWKPGEKSAVLAAIGSAIELLKQSEFHLIQRDWPEKICGMDVVLKNVPAIDLSHTKTNSSR